MKRQCEALVMGKQQKMSVLQSFKHQQEGSKDLIEENEVNSLDSYKASLSIRAFKLGYIQFLKCYIFHSATSLQLVHYPKGEMKSNGKVQIRRSDSVSSGSEQSFRLPPSSPYDRFLKAAGS